MEGCLAHERFYGKSMADMSWLFTRGGSKGIGKYFPGALQEIIRQRGETIPWASLRMSK